jgi:hypothetical protein
MFLCVGLLLAMPALRGRSICLDAMDAVESFLQIRWTIALPIHSGISRSHPSDVRSELFDERWGNDRAVLSFCRAAARRQVSVGRSLYYRGQRGPPGNGFMTFFLAFLTAFAFLVAALAFRGKRGPPGNGLTCFLTFLTDFRVLPFLAALFLAALRVFAFFAVFDALAIIFTFPITETARA